VSVGNEDLNSIRSDVERKKATTQSQISEPVTVPPYTQSPDAHNATIASQPLMASNEPKSLTAFYAGVTIPKSNMVQRKSGATVAQSVNMESK
jgi:hypothetical protein